MCEKTDALAIAQPLLAWYDTHKRVLPFRTNSTPYRVWVSEIMLQQTRVSAAVPYFERFTAELPDAAALAACPPEHLAKLWEGLGYYSRARNLQKAAQIVLERYGGELPASYDALRALPGIGEYTAGAIASISFGLPYVAVDGNVLRVFSRLLDDDRNVLLPEVKKELAARVALLQPPGRPGDYNQALMELGALVCLPGGAPLCAECPLASQCTARAAGTERELPVKTPLKSRRIQDFTVALVLREHRVLLFQRPARGLLAGLWQPALLPGRLSAQQTADALAGLGVSVQGGEALGEARHIFTHLEWHMTGYLFCAGASGAPAGAIWADRSALDERCAVPGAFRFYMDKLKNCL